MSIKRSGSYTVRQDTRTRRGGTTWKGLARGSEVRGRKMWGEGIKHLWKRLSPITSTVEPFGTNRVYVRRTTRETEMKNHVTPLQDRRRCGPNPRGDSEKSRVHGGVKARLQIL